MKRVIFNFSIIVLFALIIFTSCKDSNPLSDLDNKIIPSKNVSYSEHIKPIFDYKCNSTYCHNGIDRAGGLSLADYASTTADYLVVAPGYPDNSSLVWAIKGISPNPMPPVGVNKPLNQNQIDGVVTWIKEGAKNN